MPLDLAGGVISLVGHRGFRETTGMGGSRIEGSGRKEKFRKVSELAEESHRCDGRAVLDKGR